jgi:hypothetical protein
MGETNSPSVVHVGYNISPLKRAKLKILTISPLKRVKLKLLTISPLKRAKKSKNNCQIV